MLGDSFHPAFPRFHPRCRQLDQPLEIVRCCPSTATGVPDLLPDFMGFPVVAVVEKLNAPQVCLVAIRIVRRQRLARLWSLTKAMPRRVAQRMRKLTRDIGVGWKWPVGKWQEHSGHGTITAIRT